MSLTNYIAQSVVGALIFFPFGLGLASRCGYALSLVIGVAVFVLQRLFAVGGCAATGRDRWKVSGTV